MPVMDLQLAVVARALGDDLRAVLARSRQSGFDGLVLSARSRTLDLTSFSATAYRELRHLLSAENQKLIALRAETGPDGLGPKADVDRVLDRADGVLRAAAALQTPLVCLDLGRVPPAPFVAKPRPPVTPAMAGFLILPEPTPEPEPEAVPPKVDPALVAHWQRAMAVLGEIADRYGVVLALSAGLSPFAALAELLKQSACPWFGVDLDTAALVHTSAGEGESPDALFDLLGPQIRHVRARDAVAGDAGRSKPAVLGRGDVPWRTVLELLDAAGYHAAVTVDPMELPDPAAAAVAGLKQLRAVLGS